MVDPGPHRRRRPNVLGTPESLWTYGLGWPRSSAAGQRWWLDPTRTQGWTGLKEGQPKPSHPGEGDHYSPSRGSKALGMESDSTPLMEDGMGEYTHSAAHELSPRVGSSRGGDARCGWETGCSTPWWSRSVSLPTSPYGQCQLAILDQRLKAAQPEGEVNWPIPRQGRRGRTENETYARKIRKER